MKRFPPSVRRQKMTTDEAIRKATHIIIALGRHFGDDDAKVSERVLGAFRKAITETWKCHATIDVPGLGPTEMIDTPGIYLLVFSEHGLDRHSLWVQERLLSTVQKALAEGLPVTNWAKPGLD